MNYILAILMLSLPYHSYRHGTAIAAIVNPVELVIAADSRVVGDDDEPLEDVCKIRIAGSTVVTAHGMSEHAATGFDLFTIATSIAGGAASLKEAAAEIVRRCAKPVEDALESLRSRHPEVFERNAGTISSAVVLARWEGGRPSLGYVQFIAGVATHRIVMRSEVRLCPDPDCPNGMASIFVAPVVAETEEFKARYPKYFEGNIADTARVFVQEQIDRGRISVGPPIDIVRLKNGTVEWVQRKPLCSCSE
jgi:hypothetical protein